MERDTNGDVVMSWGEIANLTHTKQVELFNFCSCEDNEGNENPYEDCPTNKPEPTINDIKRQIEENV
jgi:hypothetical protein